MATSKVWSSNCWDPLEEIILGSARGLTLPPVEESVRHFFEPGPDADTEAVDPGTLQQVVEETEEDFAALTDILTEAGVTVRRPDPLTPNTHYSSPDWSSVATHALMPRDCLLVVGDNIIEAPMSMRARYFETWPFRNLLREYFDSGATWFAAPKPQLPNETYIYEPGKSVVADLEPLFDAANILRCGRDLFFNISNTGNPRGAEWLRRVLGDEYRVHEMSLCTDHVGTTIHILRPGLILANSARLDRDKLPKQLKNWDVIWVDPPEDDSYAFSWPRASIWVGMNIIALSPERVVVPSNQERLARQLEKHGIEPILATFRHGRTFGGGLHCCSLDVRRRGEIGQFL